MRVTAVVSPFLRLTLHFHQGAIKQVFDVVEITTVPEYIYTAIVLRHCQ
jgi:hypothetical protein